MVLFYVERQPSLLRPLPVRRHTDGGGGGRGWRTGVNIREVGQRASALVFPQEQRGEGEFIDDLVGKDGTFSDEDSLVICIIIIILLTTQF